MSRFFRIALIFVLAMTVVAAGGWFGRKAYKRSVERRLLREAAQSLEKKDWHTAALCLRRVLQINPLSVPCSKLMGDMLEGGGSPMAVTWRMRSAQLQPKESGPRLEWAQTALKFQEYSSAQDALKGMDEKSSHTAAYHKLAGALAWALGQPANAEKEYEAALSLEPGNETIILNLATIGLASTNQAQADQARVSLERMTTSATLRLTALHHLAADAASRKVWPKALEYLGQVVQTPSASIGDRLDYLALLRQSGNADYTTYRHKLEEQSTNSPAQAFALGRWMAMAEGSTNALRWLLSLPNTIQTNQPVPLIITDCQISSKQWTTLRTFVSTADWGESEYYRFAVESYADRSLGEDRSAANAWRKAVRLSTHRLDHLTTLARVTAGWGWADEQVDLLRQITTEFPKEKWATESLVAHLYSQGNTRGLQELLTKLNTADPSDARIKNNLANVYLLRNTDLARAHRLAKEAYEKASDDPFFASTYAYSLLLQDRLQDATNVIEKVKPEFLRVPSIAAYYGIIEARTAHKQAAKASLERATSAPLLPEEKDLVTTALARL
jgi:predicted Zn-dependent protease